MTVERRLALVAGQSAGLLRAAVAAGLTAPVPSCPDWTVRDLVSHHGDVLRGWASVVAAGRPTSPLGYMEYGDVERPWQPMGAAWESWYRRR